MKNKPGLYINDAFHLIILRLLWDEKFFVVTHSGIEIILEDKEVEVLKEYGFEWCCPE